MRRITRFLSPLFTAFLCLSLAFPPNCAYALRTPQPELPRQRAGMEEALKEGPLQPAAHFSGPKAEITSLAFIGGRVVAGSMDNKLFTWNLESNQLHSEGEKKGQITRFAFSPDGKLLVLGYPGGKLVAKDPEFDKIFWSKDSGGKKTHKGAILDLEFPDGKRLLSASKDGTIRSWSASDGKLLQTWRFPEELSLEDLDLHGDSRVVTLDKGRQIQVWELQGNRLSPMEDWAESRGFTLARFMPNGKDLALVSSGNQVEVMHIMTRAIRFLTPAPDQSGHGGPIRSLVVSPDGHLLATGDQKGKVILWDTRSGKSLSVLQSHVDPVVQLAFSPDGRRLLSGDQSGAVYLWTLFSEPEAPLAPPLVSAPGSIAAGTSAQPPSPKMGTLSQRVSGYLERYIERGDESPWIRQKEKMTEENERQLRQLLHREGTSGLDQMGILLPQFKAWGGEIIAVPLVVLQRGVEVDKKDGTLYFARETLRQADPEMIAEAMRTRNLSKLLAWTGKHCKEEAAPDLPPAEQELKPSPQSKKAPALPKQTTTPRSAPVGAPSPAAPPKPAAVQPKPAIPPTPPVVPTSVPAAASGRKPNLTQQLADLWASADHQELLPNTLVLSLDLLNPNTLFLSFDTADSSPDAFENIQLYAEPEVTLIVPDPKRWPGRTAKSSRFVLRLPAKFEEGCKLAGRRMTSDWRTGIFALQEKLEERKKRMQGPESSQREYLKDLVNLLEKISSLPDSERKGARARLEWQLKNAAKADQVVEVFERMDRRMVRFYWELQSLVTGLENRTGSIEALKIRKIVEGLMQVMPDPASSAWQAAKWYLDHLSAEPVEQKEFFAFLDQIKGMVSTQQIPLLAQVVPMGQLGALYHDAFRLARAKQLAEYHRILDNPEIPLGSLKDRILLTVYQSYILEWENAFYAYTLAKAEFPKKEEKLFGFSSSGLGCLFLRPDGSIRQFIAGGASIHRGLLGVANYYTYRSEQWYQPGDRVVFLIRSNGGYPNLLQIEAFLSELPLLQSQFPEVLLGTVTKNGQLRIFKPNLPQGDLYRWSEAYGLIDVHAKPFHDLYASLTKILSSNRRAKTSQWGIGQSAEIAFYEDLPNRIREFVNVLLEMAKTTYGAEKAEKVTAGLQKGVNGFLEGVTQLDWPLEQKASWMAVSGRAALLQLAGGVTLHWAERPVDVLVGPEALFEPVKIAGLTTTDPPGFPLAEQEFMPSSERAAFASSEIKKSMRQAVQRAIAGEWGPHRLGVAYEGLGKQRRQISVDLPPSKEIGFPLVTMPGAPTRPTPVPPPSRIDKKGVQESGRYMARVNSKTVRDRMQEISGMEILMDEYAATMESVGKKSPNARKAWADRVRQALGEVLQRRDGKKGTVRERLEKARQHFGKEKVERLVNAIRRLYEHQRELGRLAFQAAEEIRAAAQNGHLTPESLDRAFRPLVPALASWPKLEKILISFLDMVRAEGGPLDPALNLLHHLPIAANQHNLFALQEEIPEEIPAELYRDAVRSIFLDQLEEMQRRSGMEEASGMDQSGELLLLAHLLTDVEEDEAIYEQIEKTAEMVPPEWKGSGAPVGGMGILFLKEGRPVRFLPGAGMIVQERFPSVFYLNIPLGQMPPPEDQDTMVLLYPSLMTGSPNIEQVKTFLEDWLVLQPKTPSEIWMGAMTEEGTLRLFRPNLSRQDPRTWAALHASLRKGPYDDFFTFVHQELFTAITLENLHPQSLLELLPAAIKVELKKRHGSVEEGVRKLKEGKLPEQAQQVLEKWFADSEDKRVEKLVHPAMNSQRVFRR